MKYILQLRIQYTEKFDDEYEKRWFERLSNGWLQLLRTNHELLYNIKIYEDRLSDYEYVNSVVHISHSYVS
jgi:hypothetical protein